MQQIAQNTWSNCLEFVRDNINSQAYKTWFEPIRPLKINNGSLSIEVPSKFFYEWLEEHYIKILKVALEKELGKNARLVYVIKMENKFGNSSPFTEKIPSQGNDVIKIQDVEAPMRSQISELRNPFVIAVSSKPGGTSFNPLLVFGGVGLGKTHLAHAIGVNIKSKYPEKTVLYISAEKFTQQYIESVKKNTRNDFIHFYQIMDVLIIDDVQFFSGKSGTQDVFFHIFNHLHQNGKQVVLTSDKAPVDMQDIEQRLLSRFKWGLSAELQVPDYETRISILNNKLFRDGVELPSEIIEYVAKSVKTNIRELEGAVISLIAQASFNKKEVTIELAKQIVEKFVRNTKREISIDHIQKIVSEYFQMDVTTLQSKTRKRHIVQARQLAMFFSKKMTKASLASIGAKIGHRDHATVLHACKTVDNLAFTDKQFRKYVEDLTKKLSN